MFILDAINKCAVYIYYAFINKNTCIYVFKKMFMFIY